MVKYLLDSNIIIKLWKENELLLNELILNKKIVIIDEILKELALKEGIKYKGKHIYSERVCKLLLEVEQIDKNEISGFYMILDSLKSEKHKVNSLSINDCIMLYTSIINEKYILVTDDKNLRQIGSTLIDDPAVLDYLQFINKVNIN